MAPTLAVLGLFTLAISKCYRKVRARFFPDNSLVSRGKSHSSRASGLVVRCLLFKYSEEEGSHFFRHYETPPFFRKFFNVPKMFLQFIRYFLDFSVMRLLKFLIFLDFSKIF